MSNDGVNRLTADRARLPHDLEPFGTLHAAAHMPRVRVDDRGRLGLSKAYYAHCLGVAVLVTLAHLLRIQRSHGLVVRGRWPPSSRQSILYGRKYTSTPESPKYCTERLSN
jgi:hypothetical protein